MEGASDQAVGQTFKCPYCNKEFITKRSRGGHLKAHRHQRAQEQAADATVVQPPRGSQVQTSAPTPTPPPQQHPNTCRRLSMVVSQPSPRQKLLALPAPRQKLLALPGPSTDSSLAVTAPVQQLENAQDPTPPVVFFRCCCGVTEKIPQTTRELMERGTYKGGCFTLSHQHQHGPSETEEIQALEFFPLAEEAPVQENSVDIGAENEEDNIDLTLRI